MTSLKFNFLNIYFLKDIIIKIKFYKLLINSQYSNFFAKYCDKNLEDYQENETIEKFDKIMKIYRLKINLLKITKII